MPSAPFRKCLEVSPIRKHYIIRIGCRVTGEYLNLNLLLPYALASYEDATKFQFWLYILINKPSGDFSRGVLGYSLLIFHPSYMVKDIKSTAATIFMFRSFFSPNFVWIRRAHWLTTCFDRWSVCFHSNGYSANEVESKKLIALNIELCTIFEELDDTR